MPHSLVSMVDVKGAFYIDLQICQNVSYMWRNFARGLSLIFKIFTDSIFFG